MKLEKAIEIGKELLTDLPPFTFEQRREAVKLLIEAGEREISNRGDLHYIHTGPLPSETEE